MLNEINVVSNINLEQDVTKIMTQTNYTKEEAINKLKLCDNDYIKVIKQFMGITEKKETKIKSVNQEIYKQMRQKLHPAPKVYQPI